MSRNWKQMQTQRKNAHNLRGSATCLRPREGSNFLLCRESLQRGSHNCTLLCFRELMPLYRQQSVCELINCLTYKIQPLLHRPVDNVELVWVANIDSYLSRIWDTFSTGTTILFFFPKLHLRIRIWVRIIIVVRISIAGTYIIIIMTEVGFLKWKLLFELQQSSALVREAFECRGSGRNIWGARNIDTTTRDED